MNRKARRNILKTTRKNTKPKYSIQDMQRAMGIANEMIKATKGHLYVKHLNDKCVFCGKTIRAKAKCKYTVITFIDRMQTVLVNPDFYKDNDKEAFFFQHGDIYKDIRIPAGLKDV